MPIILDFLASHQNITELDLSWNHFHDQALIKLAANNTLHSLNLDFSFKIGLRAIIAFAKNTALHALYINGLSNEDFILLAKSNTLTQLESELSEIGPSGAVALAKNTSFI